MYFVPRTVLGIIDTGMNEWFSFIWFTFGWGNSLLLN